MSRNPVEPRNEAKNPNRDWTLEQDRYILQSVYAGLRPEDVCQAFGKQGLLVA